MKLFWNAYMNGWTVYGVWVRRKYFVGFSIVRDNWPTQTKKKG